MIIPAVKLIHAVSNTGAVERYFKRSLLISVVLIMLFVMFGIGTGLN